MNESNLYHYYLNLPIKFEPNPIDMGDKYHVVYPLERIEKEFRQWFNTIGVMIGHGEQFLLKPDGRDFHIIHTDDFGVDPIVKLNYVYCDEPHRMNWYKLKPGVELTTAYSPAGTPYATCTMEECDLVYSAQCGQPSLVNVLELHDVSKVTAPRTCYSFVLVHNKAPYKRLSWAEAEEIFKDYMVK